MPLKLPIDPYLQQIGQMVSAQQRVILTATPGAGKTTRLSSFLLKQNLGKIAVLQPRRLAAMAAAQFVAEDLAIALGEEVGFQVRGESRVGNSTQLVFMTDALFLRKIQADPELKEFSLVVIDEFHERNLHQDLVLGSIKELQDMGSSIKLLVMSATLDTDSLENFLNPAEVIDVPGQVFPLQIQYSRESFSLQTDFKFIDRVTKAIVDHDPKGGGDILVFLPGQSEMQRVRQELEKRGTQREIQLLHGSLNLQDQRKVLSPSQKPRIILSTNVAEASVTVPGVRTVIDSGLARVNRMNHSSGFSRLDLSRISQFNAKQRAGRAAREGAGICIRLWNENEDASMELQLSPECQRVDLSQSLLMLAKLGVTDFAQFTWLTSPNSAGLDVSRKQLTAMGALDQEGRITSLGEKILSHPTEPRWGALIEEGKEHEVLSMAAAVVSLLDERDILSGGIGHEKDQSDLLPRLYVLAGESGEDKIFHRLQRVRQSFQQISGQKNFFAKDIQLEAFNCALLKSQSDRLCRRRGLSTRALMANGRGIRLAPESQVKESEYFVALNGMDQVKQSETTVQWAHAVSLEEIKKNLGDQLNEKVTIQFDEEKKKFYQKKFLSFQALEIGSVTISPASADMVAEHLPEIILKQWSELIKESKNLLHWWQRWLHFNDYHIESAQLLNADNLLAILQQASYQKSKIEEVVNDHLVSFFEMSLDRQIVSEFKKQAPSTFLAPSETRHSIHYPDSEAPFVEVRIQEMFGLTQHPEVLGKPLIIKLLSPGFRPVQITSDIGNFWRSSYIEVKKELKGRYPKHSWPDDPLQAKPVVKGQHRKK